MPTRILDPGKKALVGRNDGDLVPVEDRNELFNKTGQRQLQLKAQQYYFGIRDKRRFQMVKDVNVGFEGDPPSLVLVRRYLKRLLP